MLHERVYNEAITTDINDAVIARDVTFFASEIHRLCTIIADRPLLEDLENPGYDIELTRLHLCLAFLDNLTRNSKTTQLICDFVNF